jgi:hypothetical protein
LDDNFNEDTKADESRRLFGFIEAELSRFIRSHAGLAKPEYEPIVDVVVKFMNPSHKNEVGER